MGVKGAMTRVFFSLRTNERRTGPGRRSKKLSEYVQPYCMLSPLNFIFEDKNAHVLGSMLRISHMPAGFFVGAGEMRTITSQMF